ncbi:DNA ligase D [Sporocytophaga myxococcoides]|uniref:DNA ligase D n=1 Tax=Sporocytophaga myxococcoides TaxID=153721 RepID=UPI00041DE6F2|nr:DNA ligase D [Sporocytophaga myxococcoides]
MGLQEYRKKRTFEETPEPQGEEKEGEGRLTFVVQKHDASHLHYDFRLEIDGVLKSWAVPKGPSLNNKDKRLAMMVEDHPIEYGGFEGIIPKGNYGGGTVMLWDRGVFYAPNIDPDNREENEKALRAGLHAGNLKFILNGEKLNGEFALVKTYKPGGKGNEWLLIKKNDAYATDADVKEQDRSILSGRSMEEIARQSEKEGDVWISGSKEVPLDLSDAVEQPMPHQIQPMMATLLEEPFNNKNWIFEIKWDGYRAVAEVNHTDVQLYSRNNNSFNQLFKPVLVELKKMGLQAVFDGEIVVLNNNNIADFGLIQNYKRTGEGNLVYYVFDLLYLNGYDLTSLPLVKRKELLKQILPKNNVIRYNDHIKEAGVPFFEKAVQQGVEGIIGKKADSVYLRNKRSRDWVKIKTAQRQEAVIAGFTEPRGSRKHLGSLILGAYENGKFVYIGHSGGGFDDTALNDIYERLVSLEIKKAPFKNFPKLPGIIHWVKPELVCEIKFQEWTSEGLMRIPIFMGLREDKSPEEVVKEIEADKKEAEVIINAPKEKPSKERQREAVPRKKALEGKTKKKSKTVTTLPEEAYESVISEETMDKKKQDALVEIGGQSLKFTNLKKVFWPEEGYVKQDLIEYYDHIASIILPYLKDRPESLRRNPNGYDKPSFFQKDMPDSIPQWVETVKIYSDSNEKELNYMLCQDKATLLYMANLGCIEINPWSSRIQSPEQPDYIVIDLDPVGVTFDVVIEVAQAVKHVLDRGKIEGFCKTSGSKGIHIYIPLGAQYTYDQGKDFAYLIAMLTHNLVPQLTSLERMPKNRPNKVYLDYLQNRMGQTLAAPYCLRPKPGATVSTPLEWSEVKKGLNPMEFNIKTIFKRIKEKGDIFKHVLTHVNDMDKSLTYLRQNG